MASRAGTAVIDFRGDFSRLRQELKAEMARHRGKSFDLGVGVDTKNMVREVRAARKAAQKEVAKDIVQTFAGDFDMGGFDEWMASNRSARLVAAREIETELGFKVNKKSLLTGLQEVSQARAKMEEKAKIEEVVRLRLGAEADEAQVAAAVKQVEAQVERTGSAKKEVKLELDEASHAHVKAAIEDIDRKARGIREIKSVYKVDTRTATAAFAGLNRESDGSKRSLNQATRAAAGTTGAFGLLGKSTKGLVGGMFQFKTRIPLVQLAVFGKILYTAAGGAISLAGALAPLTGLLGAIGPLASSAFQAIKTIGLATGGVGDAVKAAFTEQDQALAGTAGGMAAATGQAEQLREATRSLADAERTQGFAVKDLAQARKDGTREIEDMRIAVRGLALEEEGASLSLKEAKNALDELTSEGASDLELQQAVLRVKEARAELQATRREGQRARKDLGGVAAAGGVKGLPQVVQAKRSLEDANRGVAEAERELANAVKTASTAMAGGGGAADALKQKMAGLAPAAQDFAKFLIGLRPKLKTLQSTAAKGLLPGVQKGIKAAMENFPRLNKVIKGTSEVLGDLAEKAGKRLGSPEWGKDLETQGKRNEVTISRLGQSGLNLAEAFKDITLAAGPMVNSLTHWVEMLTKHWKNLADENRENGKLQKFFKDAFETFRTTVKILRDLTVSFKNIGKAGRDAFGNELLSAIRRGAANLREWTGTVKGQREMRSVFRDIGNDIKNVGEFIKALSQDFRQLKKEGNTTGEAIAHIMTGLLEDMIVAGAQAAGNFLKAFVKGFLKAGPFEKLILAAIALPKIVAVGRTVGFLLGAGVSQGATAGIVGTGAGAAAGGGLLATLRTTLLANAGRVGFAAVGALIAKDVIDEFGRKAREGGPDALGALKDAKGPEGGFVGSFMGLTQKVTGKVPGLKNWENRVFSDTELSAKKLLPVLEKLKSTAAQISSASAKALREEIGKLSGVSESAKEGLRQIVDRAAEIADTSAKLTVRFDANTPIGQIRRIADAFDELRNHTSASLTTTMRRADRITKMIARDLGRNSKAGRDAARENYRLAANDIRDLVDSGFVTARRGGDAIRKLFIKYLGTFGLKGSAAKFYLEQGARGLGFVPGSKGDPAGGHHRQRGGPIDIGKPHGDSVPALLERGEYVLNRKAVDAVGKEKLDQLNFKQAKRFQAGGIVALGRKLQREGYDVGEHPAFGGVAPVHTGTSYHYRGMAIDVNADNFPGGEKNALDKLYARLKRLKGVVELLWQVPNHYDHLHVAMSGAGGALASALKVPKLPSFNLRGAMGSVGAGVEKGLDSVRDAAQARLKEAAESVTLEGAEPGVLSGGAAGPNQRLGRQMASRYGWTGPEWAALRELWTRESGWSAQAVNPDSGAYGIPQALGHGHVYDLGDAQAQIKWGLNYIKDRYTTPSAALAFHDSHNWYREGGGIDFGHRGGARRKDKLKPKPKPGTINEKAQQMGLADKLPKALRQTLKRATKGTKKQRSKALNAFLKKIGRLDLPGDLNAKIAGQVAEHERYADFAQRASGLSGTDEKTGVALLAKVGNLNEGGWWVKDLTVLTKLRNNLLKVRKIILAKRAKIEPALKLAQKRLKELSKKGRTPRKWKGLNPAKDSIAKWNKQPAEKRKKRVKEWHKMHGSLPGDREFSKDGKLLVGPGRRKVALKGIVTKLENQRGILRTGLGEYAPGDESALGGLFDVQGNVPGAESERYKHYAVLPPRGVLGGYIGAAQDALFQLGESLKPDRDSSSAGSDVFDSGRADRLAELLGLERQRALIRDIEVAELLRSARQPPFAGVFHRGGTIPGPVGAERLALVQGGETVSPIGASSTDFRVIVEDRRTRVRIGDVERIVDDRLYKVGDRRTPGRAGSLKP